MPPDAVCRTCSCWKRRICTRAAFSVRKLYPRHFYLEHYEFLPGQRRWRGWRCWLKRRIAASRCVSRLPHRPHLRPARMIRIGLFMYTITSATYLSLPGSPVCGLAQIRSPNLKSCGYSRLLGERPRLVLCWAVRYARRRSPYRQRHAARREKIAQ